MLFLHLYSIEWLTPILSASEEVIAACGSTHTIDNKTNRGRVDGILLWLLVFLISITLLLSACFGVCADLASSSLPVSIRLNQSASLAMRVDRRHQGEESPAVSVRSLLAKDKIQRQWRGSGAQKQLRIGGGDWMELCCARALSSPDSQCASVRFRAARDCLVSAMTQTMRDSSLFQRQGKQLAPNSATPLSLVVIGFYSCQAKH